METPALVLCLVLLTLSLPTGTVPNRECGGQLTKATGCITSPFYPSKYASNTLCIWEIMTQQYTYIQITIDIESLESNPTCAYDYVEIRDGCVGSSILGKVCKPGVYNFFSSSNKITIVFRSDISIEGSGFEAHYQTNYEAILPTNATTTTSTDATTQTSTTDATVSSYNVSIEENGLKKKKYPVSGSCVDENTLLMSGVRGEWADWFQMIERQQ
ncbi:scavenger receptor cysteine-rich domain-containing protein DMBT1-like isoform X2 [Aquarana catesbeiana]|uniref:scavenger receptor cysteine-rich domain-containing protein DMBT1-like isoform X2 n=1 Tax=Aquarana catesbeiana TaxID=8400 RepID=UPI003CC97164